MVENNEERPQPKKGKSDAATKFSMDALPVEVVGNILSQMACARSIAVASATCRKWQEAARNHIHKLSFDGSDWPKIKDQTVWGLCELIVINIVMRTTCLSELSICMQGFNGRTMHVCAVITCLLHAKRTLRSFTLKNPINPNVNILETLAAGAGVLEHLEWGHAYIPTLDPCIHGVPSLVSLILDKVVNGLSAENLLLLFSVFPKLENLSITTTSIVDSPSTIQLNLYSLQMLNMDMIRFEDPTTLVLHDYKLGCLSVKEMLYGRVHWMRREGNKSMQYLRLESIHISDFEVGENLGHLEMEDVKIPFLEIKGNLQHLTIKNLKGRTSRVGNLVSLRELELISDKDFEIVWRHTYSEIVSKASSKLSKLTVRGSIPQKPLLDLDAIVVAHPSLCKLGVDYENTFYDASAIQPPPFKEVTILKLYTLMRVALCAPLAKWITGLLNRFPSLKTILIVLDIAFSEEPRESYEFIGMLSSLLIQMMRPYPHINVSFECL